MATAATNPKVENPKNTISQPQSQPNPSDPNPPARSSEDVRPRTTTTPPSSGGGGGETKVAAAASSEAADASGTVTDIQKKIRRAERFGMPVQLSEEEKRNSRAERFGTGTGSHGSEGSKKSEEENKRKARAERFGLAQSTSGDEEGKKKARLARFAPDSKPDPVEEEKRKARAIRFSQNESTSLTQANGNGNLETKAAAVGKASGGS